MKSRLLRRIVVGTAMVLPLSGLSLVGAQAIGVSVASASVVSCTIHYATPSTMVMKVGGGVVATVDVTTVNGTGTEPATCDTTAMTIANSSVSTISGTFAGAGVTITFPVGCLTGSYNASGHITDLILCNNMSLTFTSTGYIGCGMAHLGVNGVNTTGIHFDNFTVTTPSIVVQGNSGYSTDLALTGVTRTGTCTNQGLIDAAIAAGISVGSASILTGTVTIP